MQFKPDTIQISELFDSVHEILISQASQKKIKLVFETSRDLTVLADYNMTNTVLRNLVSNAIKFSFPEREIVIKAESIQDSVQIHVIDHGTGMDEETLGKLFSLDDNISLPGTDNERGSGLGLILCRELVEKQGGTIRAESQLNTGSTFTIILPAAGSDQPDFKS